MSIEYKDPTASVIPGGRIRFYKALGIDPGYKNSIFFPNEAAQRTFFAEQASDTITYSGGTTDAPAMVIKSPFIRTFAIPANSAELFQYDYVEVTPDTTGTGAMAKPLYMFIQGVSFVNPNLAVITCELDVIQTFMFDWELGTQSVDRMHSNKIYGKFADELKTAEPGTPSATEPISIFYPFDKPLTNRMGYIIAATEVPYDKAVSAGNVFRWYGYSAKESDQPIFQDIALPVGDRDANQLVYLWVSDYEAADYSPEQVLARIVSAYDADDKLNSIKAIYAAPPILSGIPVFSTYGNSAAINLAIKWFNPDGDNPFEAVNLPDYSNYYPTFAGSVPVVMGTKFERVFIETPSNAVLAAYGYIPKDPKTYNLLECEIATAEGQSFVVSGETDLHDPDGFHLTVAGVSGQHPLIIVFPSITSDLKQPGFDNADGTARSYTAPSIFMSNFPSYTVYNSDKAEVWATQQIFQAINTLTSSTMGLISGVAGMGGFV